MDQWLLTTHSVALFPIGIFILSWKTRKDTSSIFMLIKFLYGVTFSLLYHSHHSLPSEEVFTSDYDYTNWALLDSYACSSLIFTMVLYGLRVREPQFYITSFTVESIVLVVNLWNNLNREMILTWYLCVCSFIIAVIKWRTVWRTSSSIRRYNLYFHNHSITFRVRTNIHWCRQYCS